MKIARGLSVALAAAVAFAATGARAEDAAHRVHRARAGPAEGLRRRASTRRIPTSRSRGCRTRPASSPPRSWRRRRIRRPTSSGAWPRPAWPIFEQEGMLLPYAPAGLARVAPQYRDPKNPPTWVGMDVWGATICFNTVEAAKKQHPEARDVAGPDEARVQGPDRDAEPGVVGHRLPRRVVVDPDHGRGQRLEVHGRPARERRAVHALGLAPVRRRRGGRIRRRHLVRVSRQPREGARRADRPRVPEGRPGLGPRGDGAS